MSLDDIFIALAGCLIISFILFITSGRRSQRKFPLGPKGLPIIGNVLDIPPKNGWLAFSKWRKVYGDIVGLKVPGQAIVVLNSRQVIESLLNHRGSIYSDRPTIPMITAVNWIDLGWSLVSLRYGEEFHLQRRLMNQCLNANACRSYFLALQATALELAIRLQESPQDFLDHTRVYTGASIMRVVYGHRVTSSDDPHMRSVELFNAEVQKLPPLGTHLVDFFPFLTTLDVSIFGSALSNRVKFLRDLGRQMRELPYEEAKARIIQNMTPEICMAATFLARKETKQDQETLKSVLAQAMSAGADTTTVTLQRFLLAMMLHRDVQQKAQRALDAILGSSTMPILEDQNKLPYIQALYLETLRWNVIAPLGIPHRTTQDDLFNGQFIPKDSLIIPNIWECLRDPVDYPDPDKFMPERFLNEDGSEILADFIDPRNIAFGFGRRVCPGRYLADATVWIAIATILYVFDIDKAINSDGHTIEPDMEPDCSFVINFPKPFQCKFTPRSKAAIELLKSATTTSDSGL